MTSRGLLKGAAESSLVWSGFARYRRRRHRGETLVLAYHNVVSDGQERCGDRSLHLEERSFRRQLDILTRTHEVVPLVDALSGTDIDSSRPQAIITFDDAYRGAVSTGLRVLRERDLPATIFVAPGHLGHDGFWWDWLSCTGTEGLDPDVRAAALEECAGVHERVLRLAADRGLPLTPPPPYATAATQAELADALEYPGLTLAAHTWRHPNLTRIGDEELQIELQRPLEWLREHFGDRVLPVVSYPYGLSDSRVERAAAQAGYRAGFRISGGWITDQHAGGRFDLPRLNIPAGVSDAGFALRTSGLLQE